MKANRGESEKQQKVRTHEWFMKEALREAEKARLKEEAPIGAVVVKDGVIISRGHNEKEIKKDATLHAEMIAIRKASRKLGTWRLTDCDMYVTLEPCAMCAGAMVQCRIRRLYIGTPDPKAGAAGSVIDLLQIGQFNHRIDTFYGILEEECSMILRDFFRELRARRSKPVEQQ